MAVAQPRSTFGEVFAVGEFRALWSAQVLSVAGDQLARVALTLLVFARTHSALLAAVTFAASIVPTFVGGVTLSGLADRLPRRQVMIAADLSRAALVGIMALPGTSLAAMVCLLALVTVISAPFTSARAAIYPDILPGDLYVLGTAVTITTLQFAQVVGFAAGGAIVGFFGVRTSLLVDAATFIVSALITRAWVRARPAARSGLRLPTPSLPDLRAGLVLVFGDPRLRTPMLLGWLVAFYNVPEGVVAPLAKSLAGGDVTAGLLLAAGAFGACVGAVGFSRLVWPAQRLRLMSPIATAACGVLMLFAFRPALPVTLVLLTVSGIFDCYQLAANAEFVRATPPAQRSQAFGIAQGGMSLGQGTAMILAGAAAQRFAPSIVIAASGALGAAVAIVITLTRSRAH
ncbi:MAG TPA: MFS transporter [Streptosporangiaceae bacterium]|nr:MFS transporter [Streptosporangiaceae bacterium]